MLEDKNMSTEAIEYEKIRLEWEYQYREACFEIARLRSNSQGQDEVLLKHAVTYYDMRRKLADIGYSTTRLYTIRLAEEIRGQLRAARDAKKGEVA